MAACVPEDLGHVVGGVVARALGVDATQLQLVVPERLQLRLPDQHRWDSTAGRACTVCDTS